jgi:hypothetical protein
MVNVPIGGRKKNEAQHCRHRSDCRFNQSSLGCNEENPNKIEEPGHGRIYRHHAQEDECRGGNERESYTDAQKQTDILPDRRCSVPVIEETLFLARSGNHSATNTGLPN